MKKKIFIAVMILETLALMFVVYWWLVLNSGISPELNPTDFKAYFEEKLIPEVVKYATIALTLFFAITPYLVKIKNGADKFAKTTDDVNTTVKTGKEIFSSVAGLAKTVDAKIEGMKSDFETKNAKRDKVIDETQLSVQRMEKMMLIAFGNTEELVRKGYAAEIARVKDENKTENPTDM